MQVSRKGDRKVGVLGGPRYGRPLSLSMIKALVTQWKAARQEWRGLTRRSQVRSLPSAQPIPNQDEVPIRRTTLPNHGMVHQTPDGEPSAAGTEQAETRIQKGRQMNIANYIRPWLSYMVARLVEITTPEVLGVPGDYTGRSTAPASLRAGLCLRPNAAASQPTNASHE